MPNFTDQLGRTWSIEVNYAAVKRVRAELDLDLLSVIEPGSTLLQRLSSDEILLVDLISVLCTEQIQSRGLTAEQFAAGLGGTGLAAAVTAVVEGIADFSLPRKGAVIRKTWQTIDRAQAAAEQRILEVADSPDMQNRIQRQIESALATLND